MVEFYFVGDSWANRAFTEQNKDTRQPLDSDVRLPDFWGLSYATGDNSGKSNLEILDWVVQQKIDPDMPIVWLYTEPLRDYHRITGKEHLAWMQDDQIFSYRSYLSGQILQTIKNSIANPCAFIGGLSDIDPSLTNQFGYATLHASWQRWMSLKINATNFKFGWGAPDVRWRMESHKAVPGKTVTLQCMESLDHFNAWRDAGYVISYHPTLKCHQQFAEEIKQEAIQWITSK